MIDQRLDGYVLKSGSKYIGLDMSSGGYPYIPSSIRNIHLWNTPEEAEQYKQIMSRDGSMGVERNPAYRWKVVRVVLVEIEDKPK